jgi:hypothetical protein
LKRIRNFCTISRSTSINIQVTKGDIFILEIEANDVAKYKDRFRNSKLKIKQNNKNNKNMGKVSTEFKFTGFSARYNL